MDLLITTATANRRLSNIVVRTSDRTTELQESCKDAGSHGEAFDLMIVCFVDESPDHYEIVGNDDKVYQVEVGYSPQLSFSPGKEPEFLNEVVVRMKTVLERAPLHEETRAKMSEKLAVWERSISD